MFAFNKVPPLIKFYDEFKKLTFSLSIFQFEGLVKAVPWGNGESPTPRRGSIALNQMSSSFIWEDPNFWEDLFYGESRNFCQNLF